MRVLVTGGAGFIGHNLALYLHERGFSVVVLDSLERASPVALKRLAEHGLAVVKGDVRDKHSFKTLVEKSDVVVHLAAYISVEESFDKPYEYVSNNAGGTAAVASLCTELSKPLVYASSAAVYGNPVKTPIPEEHPLNPTSPYGLSKVLGERVVEFYGGLGLRYVILRIFNAYGIGQSGAYGGVISKFIERACKSEPLIIYGDGLQVRDFIYVDDLARLVELILEKDVWSVILNAGSGLPTRILDLAKLVLELSGSSSRIVHAPARRGDIRESWADITKARKLLGFEPRISLRDGVRKMLDYYCGLVYT